MLTWIKRLISRKIGPPESPVEKVIHEKTCEFFSEQLNDILIRKIHCNSILGEHTQTHLSCVLINIMTYYLCT